ncbi:MAG: YcxB family protein [Lachnospiraceae bacterium]|nr:YcxB family protein [Lachnospiraceae bacterium]
MKFDIKITDKDMYRFNLYHTYHTFNGIISVVVGIFVFVVCYVVREKLQPTDVVMYIVLGLALLLYSPITLFIRSKAQIASSAVLQHSLGYEFNDEGVLVSTDVSLENGGENSALLPWKDIYKIVETKKQLLIYSSRVNAYIIPVEQLGEKRDALKTYIKERTEEFRVSFKK